MESAEERDRKRQGVFLSLAFFVGVVLGVLVLGTLTTYFGRVLSQWSLYFTMGTAIFALLAGLAALFGPRLRRWVPDPTIPNRSGIAGAFVYGLLYTVATITSSAGPLLLLLTITASIGHIAYGALLSFAFGVGRALPFFLLGIFAGAIGAWLARVERLRRTAEIISGLVLIALAGYFWRLGLKLL